MQKKINFGKYREDRSMLLFFCLFIQYIYRHRKHTYSPLPFPDRLYLDRGWQWGQSRMSQNYQVKRGSVLLYPKNPKPKDWDQTHSVTYPYTSKWVDSPRNLAPDKMPNVKMGSLGWSLAQQNGLAWIGSCWKTKNSCQWWKEWNKPESIGGEKSPKYQESQILMYLLISKMEITVISAFLKL